MPSQQPYPPMRYVDAAQIEHEGEAMILLQDPEGLFEQPLAVTPPLFLVLSLLDGQSDARAVQARLMQMTGGQIVPVEQIDQIVEQGDRFWLLENERTARRRAELEEEFARLPARPASHAGGAYPAGETECRDYFDGLFEGLGDGGGGPVRGLIVPHIDYRIGGRTIAQGLAALPRRRPPRLTIVLGVAHRPTRNLFTLTDKSFETPLGLVRTDTAAAERLRALYGAARLSGELAHKTEHSVEFAAIGLRYWHGAADGVAILPILCGSLHEGLQPGGPAPRERAEVGAFIDALKTIVAEYDGDVCVVASVDLSHVGRKFGDDQGVDDTRALTVRHADERMLGLVERMDAEGFYDHFRPDANARNVDAVTAVYVLLHTLGRATARPLAYAQWREEATDSMVTYASMAFE